MFNSSLSDFDNKYRIIERKLRGDFPKEINLFEESLSLLATCINEHALGHLALVVKLN